MTLSLAWDNKSKDRTGESELIPAEDFPVAVKHTLEILNSFERLNDNWDSYGAKKPTHKALMGAASWISLLCDNETPEPSIFPSPNGNIQIEWSLHDVELEIEVMSQSTCIAFFDDRREGSVVDWEKKFTYELHELKMAVSAITENSLQSIPLALAQ
jgi:hypothetical protein